MMRTMAPKDLDGRLCRNCALTTPELPVEYSISIPILTALLLMLVHTVSSGDLAPDHSDLGSSDLLLTPVDVGDLLSKVEATRHR